MTQIHSAKLTVFSPDNPNWISVDEACQHAGETPATILGWIVHDKIGKHAKSGRGHGGAWMVNPDALERLLADRAVAS